MPNLATLVLTLTVWAWSLPVACELVARPNLQDDIPIVGEVLEGQTMTYGYATCDGNTFGEVDLYIWRSIADGAKPDGATTTTDASWFDMAFAHSTFDAAGEEEIVIPENLCTKDYVIGARNVGIFAGHYTLLVKPVARVLGSLHQDSTLSYAWPQGQSYELPLSEGCQALFSLSGLNTPNVHTVVAASPTIPAAVYNLTMKTSMPANSNMPTSATPIPSLPMDALGRTHLFGVAPDIAVGSNRLDIECTSCSEQPHELTATGGSLNQAKTCNVAPFYGGGSLDSQSCTSNTDCTQLPVDDFRCVWPSSMSCYQAVPLVGTWTAASSHTSCGAVNDRAVLNSATGWCSALSTSGDWLQIDLGAVMVVQGVETQGRANADHWVKTYKVALSTDGVTFSTVQDNGADKVFSGNSDRNSIVANQLSSPAETRFVRFTPVEVQVYMAMRAGLTGCTRSGAGLCEWKKQGAWTAIPQWRGGCGEFTDCRNASWLSTCTSAMQCNAGSQFGLGSLLGAPCHNNQDCVSLSASKFRCLVSKCQFASDGVTFADIPSWRGLSCSTDSDCSSASIAQARVCGGPPVLISPLRITPIVASQPLATSVAVGERRIFQASSCYTNTPGEFRITTSPAVVDTYLTTQLKLPSVLGQARICGRGLSCECQTSAGNAVPGAVCGSDSDCHRLPESSLRCDGGVCEYLSPLSQWVAIPGSSCANSAACVTERSSYVCGGMLSCQLATVWGGGELSGTRCRSNSDCSGLAQSLFRCQSLVCEFQHSASAAWASLGVPCAGGTDAECTAATVRGSLTCPSGWSGAYKALQLNGTCVFKHGKSQMKTSMNVTESSEMRGTACTSNSQCASMSSQYFRCHSNQCQYHEWTPSGTAIWHAVPHLKYLNGYNLGCNHDVQCQNLRSLLSCNSTQGSCKVSAAQGGGALFISNCSTSSDCHRLPSASLVCNSLNNLCEFKPTAAIGALAVPYWSQPCSTDTDCSALTSSAQCVRGQRCALADQFGGARLEGTACDFSSDCRSVPPTLFKCNTVSSVCQFQSRSGAQDIAGWRGLACSADSDCQSPQIIDTLKCEGSVQFNPTRSIGAKATYLEMWPRYKWNPTIGLIPDILKVSQEVGRPYLDPENHQPAPSDNFDDIAWDASFLDTRDRIQYTNVWSPTGTLSMHLQYQPSKNSLSTQSRSAPLCHSSPRYIPRAGGTQVAFGMENIGVLSHDGSLFSYTTTKTAKTHRCVFRSPNQKRQCYLTPTSGVLRGTECTKNSHCRGPVLGAPNFLCGSNSKCAFSQDSINYVEVAGSPSCSAVSDCVTAVASAVCMNQTYCVARSGASSWSTMASTTGACTCDRHCHDLPTANFACVRSKSGWSSLTQSTVTTAGTCSYNGVLMPGLACTDVDACVDEAARMKFSCWPASLEGEIMSSTENEVTCRAPAFNWNSISSRTSALPSQVLPVVEVEQHEQVWDTDRRVEAGGPYIRYLPLDPPRISRTKATAALVGVNYFDATQRLNFSLPALGPSIGGNEVVVSGTNFINSEEIVFGFTPVNGPDSVFISVVGTFLSPTKASFIAPAFPSVGQWYLDAASNVQFFTGSPIIYHAVLDPTIYAVSPMSGPVLGGTLVVITGKDFSFLDLGIGNNPQAIRSNLRCRFGQSPLLVVVPLDGTVDTIQCRSPQAHAAGDHTLYISMNEQQWFPAPRHFLYYPVVDRLPGSCQSGHTTISPETGRDIWMDRYPAQYPEGLRFRFTCQDFDGSDRCHFDAFDGPYDDMSPVLLYPLAEYANIDCAQGISWFRGRKCASWLGASSPVCIGKPACFTSSGSLLRGSDCTNDAHCIQLSASSFRCDGASNKCQYKQIQGVDADHPPLGIEPPAFNTIRDCNFDYWNLTCTTDSQCAQRASPKCQNTNVCKAGPAYGSGHLAGMWCSKASDCRTQLSAELLNTATPPMTCDPAEQVCQYRHRSVVGWKPMPCSSNADCTTSAVVDALECDQITSIWNLKPEFGPYNQPTLLTITGENLKNTTNLVCRFTSTLEQKLTLGTWVSPTELQCWTPVMQLAPNTNSISVVLEISHDRQRFTASLLQFNFYETPTSITSIFPIAGPVLGGTNVTVSGSRFFNSNNGKLGNWLLCTFSSGGSVEAVYLNPAQVICMSPPYAASQPTAVNLSVSLAGGQHPMLAATPFEYFPDAVSVAGTYPQSSDMRGGSVITIQGSGFVNTGAITVIVGPNSAPATFISSTRITARAPTLYNYQCAVKQDCWLAKISAEATKPASVDACSADNRATHSPYAKYAAGQATRSSFQFCSGHLPPDQGCYTQQCLRANCTAQFGHWNSFLSTDSALRALEDPPNIFGTATPCPGVTDMPLLIPWVSNELSLPASQVGPWIEPVRSKQATVKVALNGKDYTHTYTQLLYYGTPRITSITPGAGPQLGGTLVTVRGDHFSVLPQQAFGGGALPTTSVAATVIPQVRFVTRAPYAVAPVDAQWIEEECTSGMSGCTTGGTNLALVCTVPPSPLPLAFDPPNARVEVSFNRIQWHVLTIYNYTYYNWPTKVLALAPPFGPIDGGTTVHIQGLNWTDAPGTALQCRFGYLRTGLFWVPNLVNGTLLPLERVEVPGRGCVSGCTHRERQVSCVAPSASRSFDWEAGQWMQQYSSVVPLEVSLNSQQFSDTGVQFSFTPSDITSADERAGTTVTAVWPDDVSVVGGSRLTVTGLHFGVPSIYTRCKFELGEARSAYVIVAATVEAAATIQCVAPAISESDWKSLALVYCSNSSGHQFAGRSVKNSEIKSCPPTASSCHFSQGVPPDCYALVSSWLSIAIDGQLYTATGAQVAFANAPMLTKINPLSAALNVPTVVTLTGASFAPSSSLTVRFTSQEVAQTSRRDATPVEVLEVPARVLTTRTVEAIIPAHSGLPVGALSATISQDGLVYDTNSLSFAASVGKCTAQSTRMKLSRAGLGLPLDTALRPASGLLSGGYQVVLEGANLGGGTSYQLMFGDKPHRVLARCGQGPDPEGVAAVDALEEECAGARDNMEHICTAPDPGNCALWCTNDDATAKELALADVPTVIACNVPNTERFGMKSGPAAVTMTANGKDWVHMSNPFVFEDFPNPCGYTCTHEASGNRILPSLILSLSLLLLSRIARVA